MKVHVAALAAALSLLVAPAVSYSAASAVHVAGTTNLTSVLTKAAAAYTDADVDVKGTSSGAGIASIKAGEIDVAASDVAVNDDDLVDTIIGRVGIAMVTGPGTGVKNLDRKDVIAIYSGKVSNWKQLGGEDRAIVLFGRPIGTGMRFVFEQNVAKTLVDVTAPKSAPQTLAMIASTPGAIGYMGMSFIGTHTDMMISYNGVAATRENIANHSYTFATDEHLYVRKNASPQAKAFVAFVAQHKDLLADSGIY